MVGDGQASSGARTGEPSGNPSRDPCRSDGHHDEHRARCASWRRTGNLGVAALPLGATLILGGAAVASITSVTPTTPGLLTVAAQTATAVALQATSALSGQSTGAAVTIDWVNLATGQPQTSVLQVVAETQGTVIALQPGTMPNVILPLSNSTVTGGILFIPPPQASTDTQLPVINSGSLSPGSLSVTGSPYPQLRVLRAVRTAWSPPPPAPRRCPSPGPMVAAPRRRAPSQSSS